MSRVRLEQCRARAIIYEGPGAIPAAAQVGGNFRWVVNGSVVAGGTTQAAAAPIQDGYTRVTGATAGGAAVVLPGPGVDFGICAIVLNDPVAAQPLPVFPPVGGNINALAANTAYSVPTGKLAMFMQETATQWITLPNVAS